MLKSSLCENSTRNGYRLVFQFERFVLLRFSHLLFSSLYKVLNSFLNKQARLFLMSAPPIVTFYHTSRLFNEVENACSVYLCCARIDWLLKLRFERKELCKTLKMKHANRPLLNFLRWRCVFSTLREANVQSKVMQMAMTAECFF